MDYTDVCTPAEVATFREVKRRQMRLATVAREQAAVIAGGYVGVTPEREYVHTRFGVFRLAMQENSDNRTEKRAHDGEAETVVMSDDAAMEAWFALHCRTLRCSPSALWIDAVRRHI